MEAVSRKWKKGSFVSLLSDYTGVIVLFLLIIIGVCFANNFLTVFNMENLIRQICINGIMAAGFTVVTIADGFDLSMGSILSACAVVIVPVLNATGSIPLAMGLALLIGLSFGAVNGLIGKVIKSDAGDSYLITLGTSLLAQGFAYIYSGGLNTFCRDGLEGYRNIARGKTAGLQNMLIWMVSIMLITQFFLRKTKMGRKMYLVGSNKVAAYMSGVNSHNIRVISFIISGCCAAIAAIIMTSRTGSASPVIGLGYETDAAIATFVGGSRPGDVKSSMVKTAVGVLVVGLLANIMNLMNINSVIQNIAKGIVLLIALYTQQLKGRKGE